MGTKYTTNTVSGYNASPPSDGGAATEENRITWDKPKSKLTDPLKTTIEAIDTALVDAFDVGPLSKATNYNTVAGDHNKTIAVTATGVTITLIDAATATAGYTVNISNQSTGNVTVGRATSGDTINGTAADVTISRGNSMTLRVNTAANGYLTIDAGEPDIAGLAKTDSNFIVGNGTSWVAESGATARTSLGLGSAAVENIGTSGANVPLCNSNLTLGTIGLTVGDGSTGDSYLSLDGSSGNFRAVRFRTGSTIRAIVGIDNSAESGSDAGSDFFFQLHNDAGSFSSAPLRMQRSNGASRFGVATGGYQGPGTVNAQGVYDDGVLLTCYAIEAALTGQVTQSRWDDATPDRIIEARPSQVEQRQVTQPKQTAKLRYDKANRRMVREIVTEEVPVYDEVPVVDEAGNPILANGAPMVERVPRMEDVTIDPGAPESVEIRAHEPAARFAKRAAELLDPKSYGASWKATGHLPSMPSPAEWETSGKKMALGDIQQRLWETVETQAVHIDKLLARIEALEAKLP